MKSNTNPEIDQDRVEDLFDTYKKYGYGMFPQQVSIYNQIAKCIHAGSILEVGCGNGLGSAILDRSGATHLLATDKLQSNIDFAKVLYPWIRFKTLDINNEKSEPYTFVVAVEIFEHVEYPLSAMTNLMASATATVLLSTPNGSGKEKPPSNPYHVDEYSVQEMKGFIAAAGKNLARRTQTIVRHWETFDEIKDPDTEVDPLVYEIRLGSWR